MAIVSIKHKGLRRYWEKGDATKLPSDMVSRLRRRLEFMDSASNLDDFRGVPEYRLHTLTGNDRFSIWVNGNWRLTFEWINGDVYLLDFEDYH